MQGESESNKQKTYVSAILYKILGMSVYFCPSKRKQTKRMLMMQRMNSAVV